MTLAIALATNERRFGLSITLADTPLLVIILALLCLILTGLCIDLAAGWPVGTVTLWPAAVAAGAAIGLLVLELLGALTYEQQESSCC